MKNKILIASNNKGKIKEIKEIFNEYDIITLANLNVNIEVKEDKQTFKENAEKKAKNIAKKLEGMLCISDDSGIEIDILNGFPGVNTKRWKNGTDRDRNIAIIEKMKDFKGEDRRIKFTTAIAISDGINTISKVASIDGFVAKEYRGNNGFGFDEIFELPNGKTLAELTDEEKNQISARKRALEMIKKEIDNL